MEDNNNNQSLVPVGQQKVKRARKPKLEKLPIRLLRTKAYIKQLKKMKPEECYKLQMDQLDALILANKEAAIEALERCQNGGGPYALDEYKHYVGASLALSQDKAKLAEFYQIAFPNMGKQLPQSYQAPQLTNEEWEKKFSGRQALPIKSDGDKELYIGPGSKTVN